MFLQTPSCCHSGSGWFLRAGSRQCTTGYKTSVSVQPPFCLHVKKTNNTSDADTEQELCVVLPRNATSRCRVAHRSTVANFRCPQTFTTCPPAVRLAMLHFPICQIAQIICKSCSSTEFVLLSPPIQPHSSTCS